MSAAIIESVLGGAPYDPGAPEEGTVPDLATGSLQDPRELADAGIRLRDSGAYHQAEEIFQSLIDRFPDVVYGWQEMAVLRCATGRQDEALALLRRGVEVDPSDLLTRKNLAFLLLAQGDADEAKTVLSAHFRENAPAGAAVNALVQFIDFVIESPREPMLELIEHFEQSGCYLPPEAVGARIIRAVESHEPFSLIRLGDGEGAWLHISEADETRFADLYEANRRAILRIWFGSDALYSSRSFVALGSRLTKLVQQTDLIGLPSGLRLASEYRTQSIRSIPSCVNILRNLRARLESAHPASYCGQDIHLDLHLSGFWRALLSMPFTFGVVSCHPGLGYRLARSFGSRVVRAIIVPEEKGFSQIAGISGMSEPHYPRAFIRTVERLRREAQQAMIWFIAAGYLGKFYCDAIREVGGIALDVGSIVDGWCGKVTRPTMKEIKRFEF